MSLVCLLSGPPERPSNLQYSEVTHNSAKLGWTSGFNMGSTQYFVILRLTEDGLEYEVKTHIKTGFRRARSVLTKELMAALVAESKYSQSEIFK